MYPKCRKIVGTYPKCRKVVGTYPKCRKVVGTYPKCRKVVGMYPKCRKIVGTYPKCRKVVGTYPKCRKNPAFSGHSWLHARMFASNCWVMNSNPGFGRGFSCGKPVGQNRVLTTGLDPAQRTRMIDFLREYQEDFAWSYADMPSLDPSIVKHFLPLDTEKFPPKWQQLRRQRASLLLRIKEEVVKQINAGFLEVCNYSEWVANIVPVEKKDERVRVCVDYQDLNKASPKDNFPLPHIDVLVDDTACHAQFSFMDGFSEYN
ncbi:hypothetical protein CRG98_037045 [Punica granatum]|uniref:Reverse transcriptase domain-containing protein n=1 Tax=Punica granatum TaxID=22663 RepID=A0A2I0IEY3_PUNGR|nr:hypothetical protein CRG98_037045 [Punica granatum]